MKISNSTADQSVDQGNRTKSNFSHSDAKSTLGRDTWSVRRLAKTAALGLLAAPLAAGVRPLDASALAVPRGRQLLQQSACPCDLNINTGGGTYATVDATAYTSVSMAAHSQANYLVANSYGATVDVSGFAYGDWVQTGIAGTGWRSGILPNGTQQLTISPDGSLFGASADAVFISFLDAPPNLNFSQIVFYADHLDGDTDHSLAAACTTQVLTSQFPNPMSGRACPTPPPAPFSPPPTPVVPPSDVGVPPSPSHGALPLAGDVTCCLATGNQGEIYASVGAGTSEIKMAPHSTSNGVVFMSNGATVNVYGFTTNDLVATEVDNLQYVTQPLDGGQGTQLVVWPAANNQAVSVLNFYGFAPSTFDWSGHIFSSITGLGSGKFPFEPECSVAYASGEEIKVINGTATCPAANGSSHAGAIAGGVCGTLGGVALLAGGAYAIKRHRDKQNPCDRAPSLPQ